MDSVVDEVDVASRSEYRAVIKQLQDAHPDSLLVYRGQTQDYPLVPSARRPVDDKVRARATMILESAWETFALGLLDEMLGDYRDEPSHRIIAGMALLQHYGFRSWFVDVTFDPDVALWFASNRYVPGKTLVHPPPIFTEEGESPYLVDHSFAQVSTARYEGSNVPGYVYVLRTPEGDGDLLDLGDSVGRTFLRILRQQGAGLLPPLDDDCVDCYLIAKLRILPGTTVPDFSTEWLFPPPDLDGAYRTLLRTPFVVPEDRLQDHFNIAYPTLDVPVYVYREHPEESVLSLIKVVIGSHALPLPVSKAGATIFLPRTPPGGPTPVLTPVALRDGTTGPGDTPWNSTVFHMAGPEMFSVWPDRKVALLVNFASIAPLHLQQDTAYPIYRGELVEWSETQVRLAGLVEDLDGLYQVFECSFNYDASEMGWVHSKSTSRESLESRDQCSFVLAKFLYLTRSLQRGKSELRDAGGHGRLYNYYWKSTDREPWVEPEEPVWPN